MMIEQELDNHPLRLEGWTYGLKVRAGASDQGNYGRT
ncbi:hypothetical protein MNBD_GAMMA20-2549 [hydrothermal vent metagenome]|uniref:Uncharacterized protein n=1 Tax=hydrothermal vent metagenome TaxID=652676 RepID=A0A3B1B3Y0_9ZZZZ